MDIKTIDAAFNTLLATPGVSGDAIALFIDRFYTPVLELYALKFLADRRLPREEKEDLAREAARVIMVDQAAKALSGQFRFQGKSRYSTYLYRAISRALAKENRAASAALSRQRPPAPRVPGIPKTPSSRRPSRIGPARTPSGPCCSTGSMNVWISWTRSSGNSSTRSSSGA